MNFYLFIFAIYRCRFYILFHNKVFIMKMFLDHMSHLVQISYQRNVTPHFRKCVIFLCLKSSLVLEIFLDYPQIELQTIFWRTKSWIVRKKDWFINSAINTKLRKTGECCIWKPCVLEKDAHSNTGLWLRPLCLVLFILEV